MRAHDRAVVHSSKYQDYETPPDFFAWLHCAFGFTLDAYATKETAKVKRYFTPAEDGHRQPWDGEVVFYNPEYDQSRHAVERARIHAMRFGTLSVGLLAARVNSDSSRDADAGFFDLVREPAGPQRRSYHVDGADVTWRCYRDLIVGTHFLRERMRFLRNGRVLGKAPFDSMVLIFAPPLGARRPRGPTWSLAAQKKLTKKMGRFAEWPLLSEGQPW